MPELSILIPCLDEAERLPELVGRLERACVGADLDVETIVLDDASEDDTLGVAKALSKEHKSLGIRIVHRFQPRRGLGALLRYGMAHATGRYCLLVAADGAHPIEMIPKYVAEARKGAQLVQCSRYERSEDCEDIPGRFQRYQALYRLFVRLLVGWDVRDPTCSFKLFDRVHLQTVGLRANNLSIIPEINFKVFLSGGTVQFVPGRQDFRERGISQFRFLRETTSYGYVLLRAFLHRMGLLSWF